MNLFRTHAAAAPKKEVAAFWPFVGLWATLFLIVMLFHHYCIGGVLISSLWRNPPAFFAFWWTKVAGPAVIALPALVTRRRWWMPVVVAVAATWCIANIIYFRANGIFLNFGSIGMAGNMKGFGGSINTYWNGAATLFVLVAVAYIIGYIALSIRLTAGTYRPYLLLVAWGGVFILNIPIRFARHSLYTTDWGHNETRQSIRDFEWDDAIPMYNIIHKVAVPKMTLYPYESVCRDYIYHHNILATIATNIALGSVISLKPDHYDDPEYLTLELPTDIEGKLFIQNTPTLYDTIPTRNLLIVLIESLESWAIEATDDTGAEVAPNLKRLSEQASLYVPYVRSQAKEGVSGDGQMTLNTGLLPLSSGAACILFSSNTWPNITHLYPTAYLYLSTLPSSWNRTQTTTAYGFNRHYYMTQATVKWLDDDVHIANTMAMLDTIAARPFMLQSLTISTHTPFNAFERMPMDFSNDMPDLMRRYLNCVHFTDSCIGALMDYMDSTGLSATTDLVVTGDHTIFKEQLIAEFRPFAAAHGYGIGSGHNFVPLIIASPAYPEHRTLSDTCYQMDIYPTLRHLTGLTGYAWRGFGINLLESNAKAARPFTEEEAYYWSEGLIRSNYFATHSPQLATKKGD